MGFETLVPVLGCFPEDPEELTALLGLFGWGGVGFISLAVEIVEASTVYTLRPPFLQLGLLCLRPGFMLGLVLRLQFRVIKVFPLLSFGGLFGGEICLGRLDLTLRDGWAHQNG